MTRQNYSIICTVIRLNLSREVNPQFDPYDTIVSLTNTVSQRHHKYSDTQTTILTSEEGPSGGVEVGEEVLHGLVVVVRVGVGLNEREKSGYRLEIDKEKKSLKEAYNGSAHT